MEHLQAIGDHILDPTSFGVGRGPQFKVLDPVVAAVPIAMVDDFVGQQSTSEVHRHDQTMFSHPGGASY